MSARPPRWYDAVPEIVMILANFGAELGRRVGGFDSAQSKQPFALVQDRHGIKQLSYFLLRASVLVGAVGLAGAAHALSLGELSIRSGLGEVFYGTVRYVAPRGEDVVPLCIRTRTSATGSQASGVPDLPDPRIDVQPEAGGGVIIIRTARPVEEPLMRLSLSVNCGPSVTMNREYIIALDPPRTDTPPLRGAYGAPERPGAGPPAAASAPGGLAAATGIAPARAAAEERRRLRRERAAANTASPGKAAPAAAAALPYEPGVTPPPGRRGARPRVAEERQPKFRLTLSRPGSDAPNGVPLLRGSDTLDSLNSPQMAAATPQLLDKLREKLRAEWQARLADPLQENAKMQEDVLRLGNAVNDLRAQIATIQREREAARANDAKRIAQLEEDKRTLSAWLNGLALALGFIGCVAIAALLFWNLRRRSEAKAARSRRLVVEPVPEAVQEQAEARVEPTFDDESGLPTWHAEGEMVVNPPPAAAARVEAAPKPAKPAMGRPVPAGPRVATPRPTPPSASKARDDDSAPITKTIEMAPGAAAVPAVEDFYANPPRGGDEPGFSLEDPPQAVAEPVGPAPAAAPISELEAAAPSELPPLAFELPSGLGEAPAPQAEAAAAHGEAIEFSLDGAALPVAAPQAAQVPQAEAADPFGNDPAPAPLDVVHAPPPAGAAPTSTMMRMKALVDELAAAHLSTPEAPPPQVLPTGAHRTLDIDLGGDGDSEMRAQLYRQEFELKLFPEIVHGQAKLKVPQSIISLARTYYQEDFDTNRAINLLEYAADRTPDPQRVRLALLEILRMEGMAREYVAVARTFRQQFPQADEWETVGAYGKLLVPGEPLFGDADVTGYDLNMPSMWLGSTLDMTRYVLAQDLHDAMHGPAGLREEA